MSTEKKPLSLADALALFDLLTTNEAFRAAFQQDPATALLQVSADAAAAAVDCVMPGTLADAATLAAAREKLLEAFTTQAMFSLPYCFMDDGSAPSP